MTFRLFATVSPGGDGVFCIAKQIDRTNQDVGGENFVHNDAGQFVLTDQDEGMSCALG